MRKLILTLALMAFTTLAYCQRGTVNLGLFGQGGGFGNKFTPMEFGFVLDYEIFNRFTIGVQGEHNVSLLKINGDKTYKKNEEIEGRIGYTVYRCKDCDINVFAGAGCPSVSNNDWCYAIYEGGVNIKFGNSSLLKPFVGLSLREYDSHSKDIDNHLRFMGTLGMVVNF